MIGVVIMGEIGEQYNQIKKESKQKRSDNRDSSAQLLNDRGIQFVSYNIGAHLRVQGKEGLIDFWPGTGKFITKKGKKGRGVFNLINHC